MMESRLPEWEGSGLTTSGLLKWYDVEASPSENDVVRWRGLTLVVGTVEVVVTVNVVPAGLFSHRIAENYQNNHISNI